MLSLQRPQDAICFPIELKNEERKDIGEYKHRDCVAIEEASFMHAKDLNKRIESQPQQKQDGISQ